EDDDARGSERTPALRLPGQRRRTAPPLPPVSDRAARAGEQDAARDAGEHRQDRHIGRTGAAAGRGLEILSDLGDEMNGPRKSVDQMIDDLIGREGRYTFNPNDSGGETIWGITAATARRNGYQAAMSQMPRATAAAIYRTAFFTA